MTYKILSKRSQKIYKNMEATIRNGKIQNGNFFKYRKKKGKRERDSCTVDGYKCYKFLTNRQR